MPSITTRCIRFLYVLRRAQVTVCVLATLTAVALLTPVLFAATIPADEARIVKVTVYRDRAEVVERAVVQLPAGSSTIEFGGIPFGVESDSVRVAAEGVPGDAGNGRDPRTGGRTGRDLRVAGRAGRGAAAGGRDRGRSTRRTPWTRNC